MRSPFLPEIFAQSSGLVVLGRSSCSLYSWWIDSIRSSTRMPVPSAGELALDGELLGPAHDVLDHGPRGEVLEVHDLLVAVLVGDLEELVRLVGRGTSPRRCCSIIARTALSGSPPPRRVDLVGVEGQVGGEVPAEDLRGRRLVGALDLDLHVEAARAAGSPGR